MTLRRIMSLAVLAAALGAASTRADEPKVEALLDAEYARLHKELNLKNQLWATIPWKPTVSEVRAQAPNRSAC